MSAADIRKIFDSSDSEDESEADSRVTLDEVGKMLQFSRQTANMPPPRRCKERWIIAKRLSSTVCRQKSFPLSVMESGNFDIVDCKKDVDHFKIEGTTFIKLMEQSNKMSIIDVGVDPQYLLWDDSLFWAPSNDSRLLTIVNFW